MADALLIAELDSPEALTRVTERLHELGFRGLETYTPFPMPELEPLLGIRRSRLPLAIFGAGAFGCAFAYVAQWWMSAVDYRLDVGGRPFNSIPADVPIMFETTVLLAGLTAFFGAMVLSGLPRLHHPVFELDGFERTTIDRFWITVTDVGERLAELRAELDALGAVVVNHD